MNLETIRRRKTPIGVALLLAAVWLAAGIRRVEPESGTTVLDAPLGWLRPRIVRPGWHLTPPGLLRLTVYPVTAATATFRVGAAGDPLVTREGIPIEASATLRYGLEADDVLRVHESLGRAFATTVLPRWVDEAMRAATASAGYSEISGAHTEGLRTTVGTALGEKFRSAGLTLLSCDIEEVRLRTPADPGALGAGRVEGMRVLLIGLDGADWNVLDPLLAAGKLPNLSRLLNRGVRSRLHSITPMLSPVLWTSIATGVLPGRHGIIDFLAVNQEDGSRVPVTSSLRRVKAIWNILGDGGVKVGVVGWWATFPAEAVRGFMVSDRVAYQLFGVQPVAESERQGKVFPATLDPRVAELTVRPESITVETVSRYINLGADPAALPADQSKLVDDFKTLLAAGDTYAGVAEDLGARERPDFLAVYLEGTDTVAHLFMPYAPPPLQGIEADAARRFGRTIDAYYRHADELVGRLVEAAGRDTVVIVCSDHGFRTGDQRPLTDSRIGVGQAADWHRKYGVLILSGGPFRPGHRLEEASLLDITPTILALFGMPIPEDMDGRPLLDAFQPEFLAAHPLRYIPSYEGLQVAGGEEASTPTAAPVSDKRGDEELTRKLQSLGYLSQTTANSHNNRGMLLLAKGRYDEAIAEFEKAINSSEDLGIARLNIARTRIKQKDYDGATTVLNEFLERQPRSKEAENLLGNIAMERGRMQEAETHFRRALEYEPNFTDARNSLGILYDRQGRFEEALREFERVVDVDRDYAEAHNNIGVIHKKQGRLDLAVAAFQRAIAADPEYPGSYSNLALVYEARGELDGAAVQFREALRRDPDNVAVRTNYGGLLYMQGRLDDARRELTRAIETDPSYASAHNNLGAVYGRLGHLEDEIAAYRRAVELDPNYADVHHNLGLALLKRGSLEEGEQELRRALSVDRQYGPAYLNLGRALLGRGAIEEAVTLLREGEQNAPGEAGVPRLLGETLLRLGRREEARQAFRRALSIDPQQPDLVRRLEELDAPVVPPS